MKLPGISDIDLKNKVVIARIDLDVEFEQDAPRLQAAIPTLKKLAEEAREIYLIAHKGRPGGAVDESLSLKPFANILSSVLGEKVSFIKGGTKFVLLENLRFSKGEEENDFEFAKELARGKDIFVNEAFGTSHRKHASFVSLPKLLRSAFGFHFEKEIDNLGQARENQKKPVVSVISGVKKDKLDYLDDFIKISDKVLIGGRLPEYLGEDYTNEKAIVARLVQDKCDITLNSIEKFEAEIATAGTIILSGPLGKFEEAGHMQGTRRVFEAVANSSAFKLAGGGDTEEVINLLELEKKFNWISTGGGAMLEFLAKGTLPGIEAIKAK